MYSTDVHVWILIECFCVLGITGKIWKGDASYIITLHVKMMSVNQ